MNDQNIALQELIKGTYNFKFDIFQATQESCEKYSTWNRNYTQCGYYQDFGFNICCLALRGDWSQQPIFNYHFNTSNEMLEMISDPKYSFIFSKNTPFKKYQKTKNFAINFQYSDRNHSQTTDFIYNFLKIIEERNLNLRLVTGSTSLIKYYDTKCITLKLCDQKEDYISQSNIVVQQEYDGPRKRVTQFNERSSKLPNYCEEGFPEYMYKFDLPIQFWQPTYQNSIYDVYDRFWENKCNKTEVDVNRFKITSNMNSENLAVLLQRANQTSQVQYVPPKLRFNQSSDSIIEYNKKLRIFFISKFNWNTQHFELSIYNNTSFSEPKGQIMIFYNPITKLSAKGQYLMVETPTQLHVYKIKNNLDLDIVRTQNKNKSYICSDLVLIEGNLSYFAISQLKNPFTLEVKLIGAHDGKLLLKIKQPIIIVETYGFKYVSSTYFQGKIVQVYSYEQINKINGISEILFFYHSIQLSNQESQLIYPSSPLHYGTETSLKIEEYEGKLFFISTSGNGSTWSGVLINNGNWSKCSMYKDEKFKVVRNVPYTITYMWGQLDDLLERIKASTFINSCDKRIITTKVFNGKNPQITVVRDNLGKPTAYLMVEFIHYYKLPLLTTTYYISNSYEKNIPYDDDFHMTELVSFDLVEYQIFDLF